MNVVGLIPARAGSKRLPNKNLAELSGRPLIAYTCEAALGSGVLADVFVNTDSAEIADAARACGVTCPEMRPAHLATDTATTRDATLFLLDVLRERGRIYDGVMVLQPTSPLRSAEDVRAALQLFEEHAPCAVVSVSPVAPAAWCGRIGRDGQFEREHGDGHLYRLNGAIYTYRCDDYRGDRKPRKTIALVIPASRGVDIDTAEDLAYAEFLMESSEYAH